MRISSSSSTRVLLLLVAAVSTSLLRACIASADSLPNAWQIYDDSIASSLGYTNILPAEVQVAATNAGFDFSVNARLVSDYGTRAAAMGMIYGDGKTRWEILWLLNTNGDLLSEVLTNINPVQFETFQVTSNGTSSALLYHTHEIIYTNGTASFLVDGQVMKTNWAGGADTTWTAGKVFWGGVSATKVGAMNFHRVSFVVTNGDVADYNAGTEPTNAADPATQGWTLDPPSVPANTGAKAVSPDFIPDAVAPSRAIPPAMEAASRTLAR